jgi:hypothetical protein
MAQRLNRQEYQRMQQYSHGNTLNISPPPSFSKVSTRVSRKRLIYQVDHLKRSVHHHHALSSIAQEEKENTLNHQVSHGTQVITTRHLIQKDSEK